MMKSVPCVMHVLLLTGVLMDAGAATPFEAADLFNISMATEPIVSPDGERVIFTRASYDIQTDRRVNEIWLVELEKFGAPSTSLLLGAASGARDIQWSPDGSRIAYIAPNNGRPQIHVLVLKSRRSTAITSLATPPARIAWSPDGKQIAFVAEVPSEPSAMKGMPAHPSGASWAPPAIIVTHSKFRTDEGGLRPNGFRHVFVVSAHGGDPKRITAGDQDHVTDDGRLAWSPDGTQLVVSAPHPNEGDLRPRDADLHVLSVTGEDRQPLTTMEGLESDPAVSPDGRFVAYVGYRERLAHYTRSDLWIVPFGGGEPRNLTRDLDRQVQRAIWSADSRYIYVLAYDAGNTRVVKVSISGKEKPRVLVNETGGTRLYLPSSGTEYSVAAGTIAFPSFFRDRPPGLGLLRENGGAQTLDLNAEWRAAKDIGALEDISFRAPDGRIIQGWVQYPPAFVATNKYPLAVDIHGGPNIDYGPHFSITHQLFAAAGYVVLFINQRGSIGYGEGFANLINGDYPGQDWNDVLAGVDFITSKSFVDAQNVFVGGGSGGGILTAWGIGHTDRFRAASIVRGAVDWTVQALASDRQAVILRYWMQGTPWQKHDEYWQRSPLSLVGNVTTPTILVYGESDLRAPVVQMEQYYHALRLQGVATQMVRLPEANHDMGRPTQWLQSIVTVIDWYDRHRLAAPR